MGSVCYSDDVETNGNMVAMVSLNEEDVTEPMTSTRFRDSMSRIPAAVHVVTTDGPGGRYGLTVTALASVSDTPPTILVCINRKSPINDAVKRNGVFCVNTLSASGADLANIFAGRGAEASMEARFSHGNWDLMATGAPFLKGGVVALDCRLREVTETSTHSVMYGEVVATHCQSDASTLVYKNRGYSAV